MLLTIDQLHDLQSPFYRVAVKALIFDEGGRILVALNREGRFELPGGGWEHGESIEDCIGRELSEEIGVTAVSVSPVRFVFQGISEHSWHVIRLVVNVKLENLNTTPGDDIVKTKFVTKDEFLQLEFENADANFRDYADKIWSEK